MGTRGKKILPVVSILAMGLGLGLLFASLFLIWHNNRESADAGLVSNAANRAVSGAIGESPMAAYLSDPEFIPDYKLNPGMEMPEAEIDGRSYIGELSIPALDLELPVQSEWSYANLKISPCRYTGTAYQGTFAICAHNYTTHFGPIRNLEPGDGIFFTDMDGNAFTYSVHEVKEIPPSPDTQVTESGHDLVLFTCTLGGRTRVAVYCNAES